jgi:hypothetical protein
MTRGLAAVSLALLAAGCNGNSYVQVTATGAPSTGVSTGSSVYVQGSSGSTAAAVIAILTLGFLFNAGDPEQYGFGSSYWTYPFPTLGPNVPVPALEPSRRVNEQDCSKPIEDWSANLRCK